MSTLRPPKPPSSEGGAFTPVGQTVPLPSGGHPNSVHGAKAQGQERPAPLDVLPSCHEMGSPTCIQLVNMTQTDIILEKIFSSSGLVSMQSFKQLSRKLV